MSSKYDHTYNELYRTLVLCRRIFASGRPVVSRPAVLLTIALCTVGSDGHEYERILSSQPDSSVDRCLLALKAESAAEAIAFFGSTSAGPGDEIDMEENVEEYMVEWACDVLVASTSWCRVEDLNLAKKGFVGEALGLRGALKTIVDRCAAVRLLSGCDGGSWSPYFRAEHKRLSLGISIVEAIKVIRGAVDSSKIFPDLKDLILEIQQGDNLRVLAILYRGSTREPIVLPGEHIKLKEAAAALKEFSVEAKTM